jgi:hypothetical protein
MFWFLHKFKKLICPIIIFRLESTIDGEIWHLKSTHTEFIRFQLILYIVLSALKMYVNFGSKIITLD